MNTQQAVDPSKPALAGAILSQGGQSMPDLWRIQHSNANLFARFARTSPPQRAAGVSALIGEGEISIRRELQSIPAASWASLCAAAGWTHVGAASLSWCDGASDEQVWQAWTEATPSVPKEDAFFIAARSMNPVFLFEDQTLSSVVPHLLADRMKVYVTLAARPEQVTVDCTPAALHALPKDFQQFLSHPEIKLIQTDGRR
ncbi:Uncharacterised protein [Bordetella ansorpii]|uniref:Uncharacterized protein n=1 Tax=Bordetella ansorpii TaxID=288768 RepID=A0A157S8W9_9BORD|nr:hypothetical protein [Bordetella ansorpii]SAI66878.1 Uncharacterised protein [Bordetella ansorpii]